MKLHYQVLIVILFSVMALIIWWLGDSRRYDDDLERDHIFETGKTWREVELNG